MPRSEQMKRPAAGPATPRSLKRPRRNPCYFLDLPTEVRLLIYGFVFDQSPIPRHPSDAYKLYLSLNKYPKRSRAQSLLLRISRQILCEAVPLYRRALEIEISEFQQSFLDTLLDVRAAGYNGRIRRFHLCAAKDLWGTLRWSRKWLAKWDNIEAQYVTRKSTLAKNAKINEAREEQRSLIVKLEVKDMLRAMEGGLGEPWRDWPEWWTTEPVG